MSNTLKTVLLLTMFTLQPNQDAHCIEIEIEQPLGTEPYPLVIIRRRENSPLVIAEARKNPFGRNALYFLLDGVDPRNVIVACPDASRGNVLYPRPFYANVQKIDTSACEDEFVPSYVKMTTGAEGCSIHDDTKRSQIYAVGYPVGNDRNQKTEFVHVYLACRISHQTFYTIHQIESPSLAQYTGEIQGWIMKNQYQLVPPNEMSVGSWRMATTQLSLNKIAVNDHEMNHLQIVDNYITAAMIEMDAKLLVFSGQIIKKDRKENADCKYVFRILLDRAQSKGVVFITMLPGSKNCKFTCCDVTPKTGWFFQPPDYRSLLEKIFDKVVPSTRICEVRKGLINAIGIPNLTPMETLSLPSTSRSFRIPRKLQKEDRIECDDNESLPKYFEVVQK